MKTLKKISILLAVLLSAAVTAAPAKKAPDPHAEWYFRGDCDRNPLTGYRAGDTAIFTLGADLDGKLPPAGWTIEWVRSGDDEKVETGSAPADKPVIVKTKLDRPGFIRLRAFLKDAKGKRIKKRIWGGMRDLSFEGGAGFDTAKIIPPVKEPADFDQFWEKQRARLAAVPMKVKWEKQPESNDKVDVFFVEVDCPGPRPMTAMIAIPKNAKPKSLKAYVTYEHHGVGKNRKPSSGMSKTTMLRMHVNAHGYKLRQNDQYYRDFAKSIMSNGKGYATDPIQNSDPETAYFNGMTLRLLRSLEFITSLPAWDGKNLHVSGGSQGGLQVIWAAALEPKVSSTSATIPWCCGMEMTPINQHRRTWGVAGTPALRYYDPVYLASRIKCPIEIGIAGLGDYTSPPVGVFCFYNNVKSPKKITFVQNGWHNPKLVKDGIPYTLQSNWK